MKITIIISSIFCLLLCGNGRANAQAVIYYQTFNTDSTPAEWVLNTPDLGGDWTSDDNDWIINNVYSGGSIVPNTPDEPSGIAGGPESYYLHIYSFEISFHDGFPFNSYFDGGVASTYFAALNTPLVTTGYDSVIFSFWWLCAGSSSAYGRVYYRTVAGGTWTPITTPITNYYDSLTWTKQTIHLAAFDNKAFLEFAFQFNLVGSAFGLSPAFAVDDIKVTGLCTTPPVVSFSHTGTHTVNFTYTGTATGLDSVKWSFGDGATSTATNPVHSYTASGTYHACVTAYTTCGKDTACNSVVVNTTGITLPGMHNEAAVVYPNPVLDKLFIEHAGVGTQVKLLNVAGKEVYSGAISSDRDEINTAYIVPGAYLLQLIDNNGNKTKKTIIKE